MIDNFYIESAKSIRKEYLEQLNALVSYQPELKKVADMFLIASKELEDYNKNIMKEKSVEIVKNYIVEKLDKLQAESNKLTQKVEPINDRIEKLKVDEVNLYNSIRNKYTNMTEKEIRDEIQKNLN